MPSSRARFVSTNRALTATITASASVADRPASYLSNTARWKRWRSTTTTGNQTVDFDFGSSQLVQVVALVDWKAHTGGTIKAQTWNGAAWVDFGTFAQPSPNPTGITTVWNVSGVSTTKVRVLFTNTASASDYVELGVVVAGAYFEPTATVSDGFEMTLVDPSVLVASVDGQAEALTRTEYHVIRGEFERLPASDLTEFRALFASVGTRVPFLVAVDPDSASEIFYARFLALPISHVLQNTWTVGLELQEAR